jgi:hypothetical protein
VGAGAGGRSGSKPTGMRSLGAMASFGSSIRIDIKRCTQEAEREGLEAATLKAARPPEHVLDAEVIAGQIARTAT